MRLTFKTALGLLCLGAGLCGIFPAGTAAQASGRMIEDFSGTPAPRWEFVSDQVMGGAATGQVTLGQKDGQTALHLQGSVSTANNEGFIQARSKLPSRLPQDARGLQVKVRE